jgi:serine/threonine-protein phosphatase 2A regulatory subunit A
LLLKDVHPEVRLNLISKLDQVNQVIGVELLSQSLLPAIQDLAQDKKWRVRLSIIQHIPALAKQLGPEFFEAKLADLSMSWLGDQVYSIREAATANLTKLAEAFGVPWAKLNIIPKIANLGTHKSYLFRMTALTAIKDLAKQFAADKSGGLDLTATKLLPVVLKLATDPVPNVRSNVAKTLGEITPYVSTTTLNTDVLGCLKKLLGDQDSDVRYYAHFAINNPGQSPTTPSLGSATGPGMLALALAMELNRQGMRGEVGTDGMPTPKSKDDMKGDANK